MLVPVDPLADVKYAVVDSAGGARTPARSWPEVATMTLVVASATFNAVTADAMVSAMPEMTKELGSGPDTAFLAQMIMVVPSVSIIIGAPIAGLLAHRINLKLLMIPALFVYAFAGVVAFVATGSAELIASRVLLGFASGLLGALTLARAAEFNGPTSARLLGFANAMAATTAVGSFILGGWLAREFGWRSANFAYLWSLLMVPIALKSRSPLRNENPETAHIPREPFPLAAVLPIYLLELVVFMVVYGPSVEGPFVLVRHGLTDPAQIGIAISGAALTCALVSMAYGWISRMLDEPAQFITIFAAFLASALVTILSSGPVWISIGLSFTGIGSGILSPLLLSRLMRKVSRVHATTASGIFASATFVSVFLTPPAYKLIVDVAGIPVYQGLAILAGIGLLGTIALRIAGRIES